MTNSNFIISCRVHELCQNIQIKENGFITIGSNRPFMFGSKRPIVIGYTTYIVKRIYYKIKMGIGKYAKCIDWIGIDTAFLIRVSKQRVLFIKLSSDQIHVHGFWLVIRKQTHLLINYHRQTPLKEVKGRKPTGKSNFKNWTTKLKKLKSYSNSKGQGNTKRTF